MRRAAIAVAVVLFAAVLLWMHRYHYEHASLEDTEGTFLLRINQISGRTELFSSHGWTEVHNRSWTPAAPAKSGEFDDVVAPPPGQYEEVGPAPTPTPVPKKP